jgi:hypothetical protein
MPSTMPDPWGSAVSSLTGPANKELREWADQGFFRRLLLVWASAVLGKSCLLESLWVALPLIWRWYHCLKHFWNCPSGIAIGAALGHTGKSIPMFYFMATPSLWPKMVLPSLMTHFISQTWLWLTCLWAKITSTLWGWIFITAEHSSSHLDHFEVISHWPRLPLCFLSLL